MSRELFLLDPGSAEGFCLFISVRPSVRPSLTTFSRIGSFYHIFCMKLVFGKHTHKHDGVHFLRKILMPKMG